MLCTQCQSILTATSERIFLEEGWKFAHHEDLWALRASTEAGCQLCLMIWYQFLNDVHQAIDEEVHDHLSSDFEQGTQNRFNGVYYTIDETARDRGYYSILGNAKKDNLVHSFQIYFVRSEG
jgi:ribosome-associated toxin RatA of RatAB toxin-antitoxin module